LNRIIYSIGSSTREKKDFLKILDRFKIKTLVDIRRFPKSRFEYFGKVALGKILEQNKIDYLYLGDLLGGFRKGGYENHTKSDEFLEGIGKLEALASKTTCAFMCAEKFPWRCHRILSQDGFKVLHILEEDKIWEKKKKGEKNLSLLI
jgi:uncharacterized protein (DUF488 family)